MAKTQSALAAALIRKELKAAGIKASVTSKNYSGGDSVDVTMVDQTPDARKLAETICNKYQYGHFDGMNDIYEYSNTRKDIPQTKYLFVRNEMSEDMKQRVYDHLRAGWGGGEALPALYNDGCNVRFQGDWASSLVWRLFNGSTEGFWEESVASNRPGENYAARVAALEAEGLTTSDAQGVVDAEIKQADMKVQHTSGPWSIQNGSICAPNGRAIINTEAIGGETEEEVAANIHLINSAPHLAAQCEHLGLAARKALGYLNDLAIDLDGQEEEILAALRLELHEALERI